MQLIEGSLTPLKTGTNSLILHYQNQNTSISLKCINEQHSRQVQHLLNQYSILKQINHANVIGVYRCIKEVTIPQRQGNYYILAQEFAQIGNLSDLIKNHNHQLVFKYRRFLFWEIAHTLSYLHCNHIVHRDIKLDNLLVAEDLENQALTIKIADFGFAKKLEEGELVNSYKGTKRGYMAPEIHQIRINSEKQYCPKSADVFALGVVLYALVMGRLPFQFAIPEDRNYKFIAKGESDSFWKMQESTLSKLQVTQDTLLEQFKDLFMKMVAFNPKDRLKIEQVLQHPWLLGKKEQPEL